MAISGYILAGLTGLGAGGFLNVIITRLAQAEPGGRGRCRCPQCHRPLPWPYLIPLLGFVWLRGRCPFCGEPLPRRGPAVELAAGLLGVALWWRFPGSALLWVYGPFVAALLMLSVLDLEYYWLPDLITLPGTALGLAAALIFPQLDFLKALLGAAVGYAFFQGVRWAYQKITQGKRQGLGAGDAKLAAFIGAVLGLQALPWVLFSSAVLGSLAGLVVAWQSMEGRFASFPYGPFWPWGPCCFSL